MKDMVQGLIRRGHNVRVLVVYSDPCEDCEGLSIINLNTHLNSPHLQKIVVSSFSDFSPSIFLIRYPLNSKISSIIYKYCRSNSLPCLSYEQKPVSIANLFRFLKYLYLHCSDCLKNSKPLFEITPVSGAKWGFKNPFLTYFPFPIYSRFNPNRVFCPNGKVRVLTIGKLGVSRKRLEWAIDALLPYSDLVSLVIVGINDLETNPHLRSSEYCQFIETKVEKLAPFFDIKLFQNIHHNQMHTLYDTADLFILPSIGEKFGVSPLEAMSHGCAVLAPTDNGSSSYITSNYDGLLFQTRSYSAFCEKLNSLILSTGHIKRLGSNAVNSIIKNNNPDYFCDFVELYLRNHASNRSLNL